MSHCSANRGSPVGSPVAVGSAASVSSCRSGVPRPAVEATDSTPWPATAVVNAGSLERATSTPIWAYDATTVPPAASTRRTALSTGAPCGASTR